MDGAESVLRDIEGLSKDKFLPIIGREKGSVLISVIKKYNPKKILEIGTLVGYSAIMMAKNMKSGKIITLEIDKDTAKLARENIEKARLSDRIEIMEGDAVNVLKNIKEKFDLVFLDAKKEEYFAYLKILEKNKCIKKGSVIVADNVKIFASAMSDYLEYVRNNENYSSKYYDFGYDAVEVSTKIK